MRMPAGCTAAVAPPSFARVWPAFHSMEGRKMRRLSMTAAAVAGALVLAGCERNAEHEAGRNAAAESAAAADAIRAVEARWNREYAARDVEAILRHYAADGTLTGPGEGPQSGNAAIRAAVTRMVGDPAFRLEFRNERVDVASSGDMG